MGNELDVKRWINSQTRDWDQQCEAFVAHIAQQFGSWYSWYGSANVAYHASKIISTNAAAAPLNAIHFYAIGTYGHVSLSLGANRTLMASKHVQYDWGHSTGVTSVAAYCAATGAKYLGWAYSNGRDVVRLLPVAPLQPVTPPVITPMAVVPKPAPAPVVVKPAPVIPKVVLVGGQRIPYNSQIHIGDWSLQMHKDGDLTLNQGKVIKWIVRTQEYAYVTFQPDGNFVIYSEGHSGKPSKALWDTKTYTKAVGGTFALQADGNLVIRDSRGAVVWARFGHKN